MRTLCVCEKGNIRSVTLAYILKTEHNQLDVISCGIKTTTREGFEGLAKWADRILAPVETGIFMLIPDEIRKKAIHMDIGGDFWGVPHHPELMSLLREAIKKYNI